VFKSKMRVVTSEVILAAMEPEQIFGDLKSEDGITPEDLLRSACQHYARCFGPDRNPSASDDFKARATRVMQALNVLRQDAEKKLAAAIYGQII